jgi:hypothetical protein
MSFTLFKANIGNFSNIFFYSKEGNEQREGRSEGKK